MWSGLHDRKKKWEGWAALDSFAGSNLSLRGVFGGCMLPYRLHLLCDKNVAISLCSMRNVGWVERPCPEVTLELGTPDRLWGTLGPVAMGWSQLGPGEWWHWWGRAGLPWAVEDEGTWGLGFLPGIPNECSEENGENCFFEPDLWSAGYWVYAAERQSYLEYTRRKMRVLFQNCSLFHLLSPSQLY